ncbi:MAG: argininosuccinate lyase [Firmicutes bacterium]|nr:argininosuccinate lyase [Bacillota bacterium]
MKLWGGRFKKEEDKQMEDFNSSLHFDKRLYKYDILGSIAHVNMLGEKNIIKEDEKVLLVDGLKEILKDIENDKLKIEGNYEDIHSFIEAKLIEKIGKVGKKLHTSRSRNDQVALDMKLFTKEKTKLVVKSIESILKTIKDVADKNKYIMPGYTHLQRAQVVTFKHHLLAYYNMFLRDKKRLLNALEILDENPLGCCALAGTTYDIDRDITTKELGFKKSVDNFLDGVSDRDYLIEITSSFSIMMMHLSRLCEELILWSSQEFNFITIDDSYSTGSSIMPQKKNPDAAELIRGKTGSVYGNLFSLLTVMKGLPLAYNKDMQEDKIHFFNALDTVIPCIEIMDKMIKTLKVNKENMKKGVKKGFLNATEVADYLVNKGVAFRDAHKIVGEVVLYCEEKDSTIEDLKLDDLKNISSYFEKDLYDFIDYENVLKKGIKKDML